MYSPRRHSSVRHRYLQIAADFISECYRLAVPIPVIIPFEHGFRFSFRDENDEEIELRDTEDDEIESQPTQSDNVTASAKNENVTE